MITASETIVRNAPSGANAAMMLLWRSWEHRTVGNVPRRRLRTAASNNDLSLSFVVLGDVCEGMMHDDYEDDDYEEDCDNTEPKDGDLTFVVSGYSAEKIDEIIESKLSALVRGAVEKKLDKVVERTIANAVEEVADHVIAQRLENELDICLEEGWKRTDTWGKSCGGTVTLKDRVMEYLNESASGYSKQRGEKLLRDVLDKKTAAAVSEFVAQLQEQLKAETDAMIRNRVDADSTIAAQLKETVLDLFGAGKKA